MTDFDRASPEYFERAVKGVDVIFGLVTDVPPETFEELRILVDSKKNNECGVSNEIDKFVELIAADPNPDEIARSLLYDTPNQSLVFILPKFLKKET